MTTAKSLLVAALLSTFAAVSFAQPAPAVPHGVARHHHHHKHHGHHRHHGHHGHKAATR